MNLLQELMVITMEECGELTQQCSKTIRKYKRIVDIKEEDRKKLIEEVGDVFCMIDLIIDHGLATEEEIYQRSMVKAEKLKRWSKLYHELDAKANRATQQES
jgi:NTP pyrophosphatase (non-canonical NTP hydrolase)